MPTETCSLVETWSERLRPTQIHRAIPSTQSSVPSTRTRVTASISDLRLAHAHRSHLEFRFPGSGVHVVRHDPVDQQTNIPERREYHPAARPVGHAGLAAHRAELPRHFHGVSRGNLQRPGVL